jgi:hypothetical protein
MYGHGRDEIDINGAKIYREKKKEARIICRESENGGCWTYRKRERCTGDIRIFSTPREKVLFFFFLGTILLSTKTKWESRSGRRR